MAANPMRQARPPTDRPPVSAASADLLTPYLAPGEEVRRVVVAPVATLDTFLGPVVVAVPGKRVLLARRRWAAAR